MAHGTLTPVSKYTDANKRVRVYDIQLTSGANYTAGGEVINASEVGLNQIQEAVPHGLAVVSGAATSRTVAFIFGQGTGGTGVKMSVQTTASAEAAAASDQSGYTVRVTFRGR